MTSLFGSGATESLVRLDAPQSSIGAPMPAVLANEQGLFVCYVLEGRDPNWDGRSVRLVDHDSNDEPLAILKVRPCYAHFFGPPNDEAISGHRLATIGLEPYSVFEVTGSAWIAELERANRVHPHHRPERYALLKHFIFTFHDSVLEFVSKGFDVEITSGSARDALRRCVDLL